MKTQMLSVLHSFSMTTVEHASKAKNWRTWTLWTAVLICAIFATLFQSHLLLNKYKQFGKKTIMKLKNHKTIRFPAVTVCNLNPYKRSEVEKVPEIAALLEISRLSRIENVRNEDVQNLSSHFANASTFSPSFSNLQTIKQTFQQLKNKSTTDNQQLLILSRTEGNSGNYSKAKNSVQTYFTDTFNTTLNNLESSLGQRRSKPVHLIHEPSFDEYIFNEIHKNPGKKRETRETNCFKYDVGKCYTIKAASTTINVDYLYISNLNETVYATSTNLNTSLIYWKFLEFDETNQIYTIILNTSTALAWDLQGSGCLVLNNISTSPSQKFYIRDSPVNTSWCQFYLLNTRDTIDTVGCAFPKPYSATPKFKIEQATTCPAPMPIITNDCFEYVENKTYRIINVASNNTFIPSSYPNEQSPDYNDSLLWSFTPVPGTVSTFYISSALYQTVMEPDNSWYNTRQACKEEDGKGRFIVSKHSKDKCYIGIMKYTGIYLFLAYERKTSQYVLQPFSQSDSHLWTFLATKRTTTGVRTSEQACPTPTQNFDQTTSATSEQIATEPLTSAFGPEQKSQPIFTNSTSASLKSTVSNATIEDFINAFQFDDLNENSSTTQVSRHQEDFSKQILFSQALPFISATMSEQMRISLGYQKEDMIIQCRFNGTLCSIQNDIIMTNDLAMGNCFTFNHATTPSFYSQKIGQEYGLDLCCFEGLALLFKTDQASYLNMSSVAGLKVYVNDVLDPVFSDTHGQIVSPGYIVDFTIDYYEANRALKPYGNCTEVVEKNNYFYHGQYLYEGCIRTCYQKEVINKCMCADPRFPLPESSKIKMCLIDKARCVNKISKNFVLKASACNCEIPCHEKSYKTISSMKKINTEKQNLSYNVGVNIYFRTFTTLVYNEVAAYDIVSFWSEIGGITGNYLDASFITISEIFILLFLVLFACLWKKQS